MAANILQLTMKASVMYLSSGIHHMLSLAEHLAPMCKHNNSMLVSLCGYVSFDSLSSAGDPWIWNVTPIQKHVILIEFIKFNVQHSRDCKLVNLEMVRHEKYGTTTDFKCGTMPSWNETCPCIHLTLKMNIHWRISAVYFSMRYFVMHKPIAISFMKHSVNHPAPRRVTTLMSVLQTRTTNHIFYFSLQTGIGYLVSVHHTAQSTQECNPEYRDGPSSITQDIVLKISKTHQLTIISKGTLFGCWIYEHSVEAPRTVMRNVQVYNITYLSSSYYVLCFAAILYSRIHLHIQDIHMTGQTGINCEYGGFQLELIGRIDHGKKTLLCEASSLPPRLTLSSLAGSVALYAYLPYFSISTTLSVSTASHYLGLSFWLTCIFRNQMRVRAAHKHTRIYVMPVCERRPAYSRSTLQMTGPFTSKLQVLVNTSTACKSRITLSGPCQIDISTLCCWKEPVVTVDMMRTIHYKTPPSSHGTLQLEINNFIMKLLYVHIHMGDLRLQSSHGYTLRNIILTATEIYKTCLIKFSDRYIQMKQGFVWIHHDANLYATFHNEIGSHTKMRFQMANHVQNTRDWYGDVGVRLSLWFSSYSSPRQLCTQLRCYTISHTVDPWHEIDLKRMCPGLNSNILTIDSYEEYELIIDFLHIRRNYLFGWGYWPLTGKYGLLLQQNTQKVSDWLID